MAATRPTAVNLFWAIDRMKRGVRRRRAGGGVARGDRGAARARGQGIHDEDVANCRTMGGFGAEMVKDGARVLTHCNAGALATAGYGSALGVIRAAVEQGKKIAVFADETRPFMQGARLTAWELVRDGINTTVITESMAGPLMRDGEIDIVDRRRRSHRRQRRHRQQDRHLHRRGAGARAQHSVLRRRAALDDRPGDARRQADPDRGARPARGHATSAPRG